MISSGDHNHQCLFSAELWGNDKSVYYSQFCIGCSNCFGCIGLRNKQYCIFNKQYENKDKYEEQVAKIIIHMQNPLVFDNDLNKGWGMER
jgi:hypothetical protein